MAPPRIKVIGGVSDWQIANQAGGAGIAVLKGVQQMRTGNPTKLLPGIGKSLGDVSEFSQEVIQANGQHEYQFGKIIVFADNYNDAYNFYEKYWAAVAGPPKQKITADIPKGLAWRDP